MPKRPKIVRYRPRLLKLGATLHGIHEADEWGCMTKCGRVTPCGLRVGKGQPTCGACLDAIRLQDRPIGDDEYGPRLPGIRVFHDKPKARKEVSS